MENDSGADCPNNEKAKRGNKNEEDPVLDVRHDGLCDQAAQPQANQ